MCVRILVERDGSGLGEKKAGERRKGFEWHEVHMEVRRRTG